MTPNVELAADFLTAATRAEATRSACPLSDAKGYDDPIGCGLSPDGSDCDMSGIGSECIFKPHPTTYAREIEQ